MLDSAENGAVRLDLTVSTDGGAFLRQTCSSCGLDFKTDVDPAGLADRLSEEVALVGVELGVTLNPLAVDLDRPSVRCPYCAYDAAPEDLMTNDRHAYLSAVVTERVVRPAFDALLRDAFGPQTGGIITVTAGRSVPPPLPIDGPEPADMVAVHLLCCGRRVKVLEGWRDFETCPYCHSPLHVE